MLDVWRVPTADEPRFLGGNAFMGENAFGQNLHILSCMHVWASHILHFIAKNHCQIFLKMTIYTHTVSCVTHESANSLSDENAKLVLIFVNYQHAISSTSLYAKMMAVILVNAFMIDVETWKHNRQCRRYDFNLRGFSLLICRKTDLKKYCLLYGKWLLKVAQTVEVLLWFSTTYL